MILGASVGVALPGVEAAIGASIGVMALMLALGRRMPLWVPVLLVCACAIFHGHAHAAEQPAGSTGGYILGFALSTAMLHAAGIVLGAMLHAGNHVRRMSGAIAMR
jgi:urease accessory protein